MGMVKEVQVPAQSLDRFVPLVGERRVAAAREVAARLAKRLGGRPLFNVNSTHVGGGVAEMLRPLLAYARGAGIGARWLVVGGSADFFRITKRLHNALHGERGDGTALGSAERALYEDVLRENARELLQEIRRGDMVLLHDPQTAGLAPALADAGAQVVWRCHIGSDTPNAETERGWRFLLPYVERAAVRIFSRAAYVPSVFDPRTVAIVQPSIDPFSTKNQEMAEGTVRAILAFTGLVEGPPGDAPLSFTRIDGSVGDVVHAADVLRLGRAAPWDRPLIVQVSRWDHLKDPCGVIHGFVELCARSKVPAELLLAGPNVRAVADDPDGARVFDEVMADFRTLPHEIRKRVHLASLPTHDVEENAAIVNALQRHAAVVVQKSLREGFGLTVTEAMWKSRPVVASRVGGIQDQITDGVHGLLLDDPEDLDGFARLLDTVLSDPSLGGRLGTAAHHRAKDEFTGLRHLMQLGNLLLGL